MVESFVITNLANGLSAKLGQSPSFNYVYKEDGIDWGSASASHNSFSFPNQTGEYIASTEIKERIITISAYVVYVPSEMERNSMTHKELIDYCYKKILERKGALNDLVNPTQDVRISIGDYYIEGRPQKSIVYGGNIRTNNKYFCQFLASIYCGNPMFHKKTLPQTVISGSKPAFRFPLVFPKNKGIIMGIRSSYRLIALENEGNVPTGCIITLTAKGAVDSPTITIVDTGESITIDKVLVEGETIEINTNDGKEKGITGTIDGISSNYFKYWNYNNTWLKFPIGTTLVGYSLKGGDPSLIDISISLNPLKYALEDM